MKPAAGPSLLQLNVPLLLLALYGLHITMTGTTEPRSLRDHCMRLTATCMLWLWRSMPSRPWS